MSLTKKQKKVRRRNQLAKKTRKMLFKKGLFGKKC
jgi:hypothetical protein